jgi:hypothetical protein
MTLKILEKKKKILYNYLLQWFHFFSFNIILFFLFFRRLFLLKSFERTIFYIIIYFLRDSLVNVNR